MVTASEAAFDVARTALVATGLPEESVHPMVLPAEIVRTGLTTEGDTFGVYARVALATDAAALDAWFADPPVDVLRVTPESEATVLPLTTPAERVRGTGESEELTAALDTLEAAILERLADASPGSTATPVVTAGAPPELFNGTSCIERSTFCGGDNRDALYMGTGERTVDFDPGYVLAYGVNHAAVGKAVYANAVVQYVENALGVVGFDSSQMPGTASELLPDAPDADLLYLVAFARDCTVVPFGSCVEVPAEGCPLLPEGEDANIVFRAYLEPSTGTGPDLEEIVVDRVLQVVEG